MPEQRPELKVNQLAEYMKGWTDALRESPEFCQYGGPRLGQRRGTSVGLAERPRDRALA